MSNNTVIKLNNLVDGGIQIELCALNESFVMKLHNKSCEPLAELGETLLQINDYYLKADKQACFPKSFYIFWECRHYQYTLEFILHEDRLVDIKLSYCPDIFAGIRTENELQLTVNAKLDILLDEYHNELRNLLLEYGFVGYKDRWKRHDFPISMFLKLHTTTQTCTAPQSRIPHGLMHLKQMIHKGHQEA